MVCPVPKGDCFLSAMLISTGKIQHMNPDNPSDEDKEIWAVVNSPFVNQLRQSMASVIFTIHEAATIAFGTVAIDKLFGDHDFNRNRWRKIIAEEQDYNPWQTGTWGGDIELPVVVWVLKVNLNVLTHTDELLPVQQCAVRTFHFDVSTTVFLHLTGNQTPLVTPLPGDEYRRFALLPKIANFVTVDL